MSPKEFEVAAIRKLWQLEEDEEDASTAPFTAEAIEAAANTSDPHLLAVLLRLVA